MRILLVEDDRSIREVVELGLQRAGFAVTPVGDGREALDRFRAGGHLSARVVNGRGVVIASWSGRATCSGGCRGGFWAALPFTVGRSQVGAVIVQSADTDGDGLPQHQVRVPVVLDP